MRLLENQPFSDLGRSSYPTAVLTPCGDVSAPGTSAVGKEGNCFSDVDTQIERIRTEMRKTNIKLQNKYNVLGVDDDSDAECEGSEDEESEVEVLARGKLPTPILPTTKEVEQHEDDNHAQFRNWCSPCVRGRARANPHRKVEAAEKNEEQIPLISVDYGFFSQKQEASKSSSSKDGRSLPVLIVKDRRSAAGSGAIWSIPVPKKGVEHPYPARKLLEILEMTGYRRILMKSDQENAIEALIQSVKDGWKGEIMPEGAPKGQSQSNGEVERAVQEVQGLARTLKDSLEQKSNYKLPPTSPLLAWLVEYAGVLCTIQRKGKDGHTP